MTPERWKRIEEIFHLVTEIPLAEREAFLERVCGQDAKNPRTALFESD
jgi:hypothetical protein